MRPLGMQPCRTLLVEDNDGDARLVQEFLRASGRYAVTRVNSCAAAIEALAGETFDVALADLGLPDSQGLSVVGEVRKAASDLPIVVLTGASDKAASIEAIRLGVQDYLGKSTLTAESLSRSIGYAIERMRTNESLSHLNRVLRAIRNVNQIIVRENDPERLARAACTTLARGYDGAWIALRDGDDAPKFVAQQGWTADQFRRFEAAWRSGAAPPCVVASRSADGATQVCEPTPACSSCGLPTANGAALTQLRHGTTTYGELCVAFPKGLDGSLSGSELALVQELADDIAYGLHNARVEKARAVAEQRYRALVEGANVAFLVATSETRIVEANRQAALMFGARTPEELVGKAAIELVAPESHGVFKGVVSRLREQGSAQAGDLLSQRLDGSKFSVDLSVAQITLGGQNLDFLVLRDVTEQKKLQAQVMVSDRMASIGTLAAGVAHEINNPLTVVLANLDFAVEEASVLGRASGVPRAPLAELQEALADGKAAAERVRQIVKDLKLFSRSEEDSRANVNVEHALDSSLRMAWNEIRHRATLVKNYGSVPDVFANEARLGQVFLNLAVNAAQAIPEGHANENEITVTTRVDPQGRVIAEIRDSGPGIPPETLAKLFTPFFTTKPAGVGTGLGLVICHRIVTELGGEITIESEVGRGTVCRVTLLPSDGRAAVKPVASIERGAIHRGRVLVVDDEVSVGSALRRLLHEHEVLALTSASEALRRIRGGERFDLIICDVMMPDVSGADFFRELNRVAPEQAERVIFLTGGAFTADARSFLAGVSNLRLEKPFEGNSLRSIVNERIA